MHWVTLDTTHLVVYTSTYNTGNNSTYIGIQAELLAKGEVEGAKTLANGCGHGRFEANLVFLCVSGGGVLCAVCGVVCCHGILMLEAVCVHGAGRIMCAQNKHSNTAHHGTQMHGTQMHTQHHLPIQHQGFHG